MHTFTNISISVLECVTFECLPVGLILIFLAVYRKSFEPLYAIRFLCAAVTISTVMLFLSRMVFLSNLTWNWQGIIMVLFSGTLLGIIREKSGSIWPGVLLHNIMNGLGVIFGQLLA